MPPNERANGPKVRGGAVAASLVGLGRLEKRNAKAAALAARPSPATFAHGAADVAVSPIRTIEGGIEFDVTITEGGADVTPPGLNPCRIINPPILVPDGTKSTVELPFGNGTTKTAQVDNYVEDLDAAFAAIVAEHVRVNAKR